MQNGVSMWARCRVSVETLDRVYGHHHPDSSPTLPWRSGAHQNWNEALVVSLVGAAARREKRK